MKSDVVISWSFATVPAAVKAKFQRPTRFVEIPTPAGRKYGDQIRSFGWPNPLPGIIAKYAPGVEAQRVAALGFSESCGGVGGLLKSGNGGDFDAAVAVDGIHVAPGKVIPAGALVQWVSFAQRAALGTGLCVITHSSVVPPYVSTTQTADYIWEQAAKTTDEVTIPAVPDLQGPGATINVGSPPANKPYSVTYPDVTSHMQAPRRANGLVVLGWDNLDVPAGYADHIWQARVVLPLVLERFLVARWNAMDPDDPEASCYVG